MQLWPHILPYFMRKCLMGVCVCIRNNTNRSFRWKFNNSGETLDVGKERHHRNGSTSVLQYTPVTDQVNPLLSLSLSLY